MGRARFSLPFWATFFTVLGVLILFTLSYWQFQRLQWKNDIIRELSAAYTKPQDLLPILTQNDESRPDFAYGTIKGRAQIEKAIALGPKTQDGKIGHHVIVPIIAEDKTILVNLGWSETDIDALALKTLKNALSYEGLVREPDWNRFTSQNSPANNLWFRADIDEIAKAKSLKNTLPYMLYVSDASLNIDGVFFHEKNWYPRNKHAEYSTFWAMLGLCLIGIYVIRFTRKNDQ